MGKTATRRKGVFVSYSHEDKQWLDKLRTHLAPLIRNEAIDLWDDTRIPAGSEWAREITTAIEAARVAVLLVTPTFVASDFIATKELPRILKARENQRLVIFWIAVSYALYEATPLQKLQAANDPQQPLDSLSASDVNRVLVGIAKKISDAVSLSAVANSLSMIDDLYEQVQGFDIPDGAPRAPAPGTVAEQRADEIHFVGGGAPPIRAQDMDGVSEGDQQLLRDSEARIEAQLTNWNDAYTLRNASDETTRDKARAKLESARKELLPELERFNREVTNMRANLPDHYGMILHLLRQPIPN